MKAYNDGTNTPFLSDNDRPQFGQPVIVRPFSDDEKRWPKWKADGTDVIVDSAAKAAWEITDKANRIDELTKDGGELDKKTIELIGLGFAHPSNTDIKFSLSEPAQISLVALSVKKDVITYPRELSKKGGEAYSILNADELDSIAMAAMTRVSGIKEAGNDYKTWLRDPARTYVEIKNFVDGRV